MGEVADFNRKRNERDAHKYRLLQAGALLELFKRAHDGKAAASMEELEAWMEVAELPPGPIDPVEVLGPEWCRRARERIEHEVRLGRD